MLYKHLSIIVRKMHDNDRPESAAGQDEIPKIASAPTGEHRLPILQSFPHNRASSLQDLHLSHILTT
jgi:hypothetical protein